MKNEQEMIEKHQKECAQGEKTKKNNASIEEVNQNEEAQDKNDLIDDASTGEKEEDKHVKMLVIKTHKLNKDEDPQEIKSDTASCAAWLASEWIKRGDVKGVKDASKDEATSDLSDFNL